MHTNGSVLFISHAKQMVIFFITSIFLLVIFYKFISLETFFFLQAMVVEGGPSPLELFFKMHMVTSPKFLTIYLEFMNFYFFFYKNFSRVSLNLAYSKLLQYQHQSLINHLHNSVFLFY
jgi:hypothetical protein